MKPFKTRIEAAIAAYLTAAKANTVLSPVPIVLGDSEQERPQSCVVVYADTDRNAEGVPAVLKNRETLVKVALYHDASDITADAHLERFRVIVEALESNAAVMTAIAAQDIRPYAFDLDSEDDVSAKNDFIHYVAYRVRGVDNPQS